MIIKYGFGIRKSQLNFGRSAKQCKSAVKSYTLVSYKRLICGIASCYEIDMGNISLGSSLLSASDL